MARNPGLNKAIIQGLQDELDAIKRTPGSVFYVDSGATNASDTVNAGDSWDSPLATLDAAIGKCTANNGDIIYLAPGHAESLTAADDVDCDVAGITIIGLGSGSLKPTFSTTAAAGSITVDAANVTIKNIRMVANFATGTTTGMTLSASATFCSIIDCDFRDTSAANEFLIHISVAALVTDLHIKGCSFITAAGSMTGSVVFAGASTDTVIEDSEWYVDSSDSVIDHQTTAAIRFFMRRCAIVNIDTGAAGYCVELKTASTGCVHDCRFGYNKIDAEISLGDAVFWFENYASNTIAESGLLDPSTAHAIP